jgi:hypothetical protein
MWWILQILTGKEINIMTFKTLKLKELEEKQLKEILQNVSTNKQALVVQLPEWHSGQVIYFPKICLPPGRHLFKTSQSAVFFLSTLSPLIQHEMWC